ncbi:MAG: hypothetical protein IJ198_14505 [Lachnospiraceae bacterium]|nr:hypothetical protein [Lachnospiraceae bacterium]
MKLPVRSEIMENLVQERKENQREEKLIQEEIDSILEAKSTSKSAEEQAELDERLQKLSEEKDDLLRKRRDLCSMARAVGAGD